MRVLMVAVNHQIQPARIKDGGEFERVQKEAFGQMLREMICRNGIQLVGEEARHGEETVAQRVCGIEKCRHANIDMTLEERVAHNIPLSYHDNPHLAKAEKARCDNQRERHMVSMTLAEAGEAENILLICGRHHCEGITAEFKRLGHCVVVSDLQDQEWYVEDWIAHVFNL